MDRLIAEAGWTWPKPEPYDVRGTVGAEVQHMVVRPLADFGMLSTESVNEALQSISLMVSLMDFGRALLQSL